MPLDAENRAGFAPPPLLGANNMEYIPWTQGKFADRVRCDGKTNGWSFATGTAWLPNDSSIRFAFGRPGTRNNGWWFMPNIPKRFRDRGQNSFRPCDMFDVPELLRELITLQGTKSKRTRHPKKDPRVSNELAALAAGCVRAGNSEPLTDWLQELGHPVYLTDPNRNDYHWNLTIPKAGALARWEWPFCEGDGQ